MNLFKNQEEHEDQFPAKILGIIVTWLLFLLKRNNRAVFISIVLHAKFLKEVLEKSKKPPKIDETGRMNFKDHPVNHQDTSSDRSDYFL